MKFEPFEIYYIALGAFVGLCAMLIFLPGETLLRTVRRIPLSAIMVICLLWLGTLLAYSIWRSKELDVSVSAHRVVPNSTNVLVLIYGWTGDQETWSTIVPLLKSDTRLAAFEIQSINFASSNFFDRNRNLEAIGRHVLGVFRGSNLKEKQISIVTHSTGGLLARQAILEAQDSGNPINVRHLISLAAPHGGTDVAQLATHLGVSQRLLLDLLPQSPYLRKLEVRWLQHRMSAAGQFIAETCIVGSDDRVVPRQSASAACQRFRLIDGSGHADIQRPTSMTDRRYDIVTETLLDAPL